MAAPTSNVQKVENPLANPEPSTHGREAEDGDRPEANSRYELSALETFDASTNRIAFQEGMRTAVDRPLSINRG
jgi:hypothetical protein